MSGYHVSALVSDTPIAVASGGTGSSTATGTGSGVLATSPTLTTPIITGSTTNYTAGVLAVVNNNSDPAAVATVYAPSIATSKQAALMLGKDSTANNSAGLLFEYSASGSSANAFAIGFAGGADLFKMTAAGVFTLLGAVAVNSLTSSAPIPVTSGGTGVSTSTGSGANVLSVSPTFTGTAAFAALTVSSPIPVSSGGTGSGTATGTGQTVLDTSPTLTTPTFTGNTSTFSTGVVTITNTNIAPNSMASIFAPSIANGNTASILLGKDATTNNSVGLAFEYSSTGSSSNAFALSLAGTSDLFKINATGAATFSGSVAVNSFTSANAIPVTSGGTGVTTSTGSGANVLSASPTFTGTAAFAALTASTPIPITSGGTGTSSSTGTGAVVLAVAPTITTSLVVDGNTSSFSNATFQVLNSNSSPLNIANFLAANLPNGSNVGIVLGQATAVGNAVGLTYKHVSSNSASNSLGIGFYGYSDVFNINRNGDMSITGSLTATNISSGTWTGSIYGWNGSSVVNPTGGPWTVSGSYSRNGNSVTATFAVTGTYSSAAVSSYPLMTGFPLFGKSLSYVNCVLDSSSSGFTGASLPYSTANLAGNTGADIGFYSGASRLGFQISGGSLSFYGCMTYYIV